MHPNKHPSGKSLCPAQRGSEVDPPTPTLAGGTRAHASLQPPVSPGLPSISLLTDLRVGQDFQSFMTLYLSLQVSGGTQPDPQPLSQLLICLYGFILCVKPAHNSITVRVTKLSPERHKWFSLLMAASRGNAVMLPRRTHILSPAWAWFRHLLLCGEHTKEGFRGDVWSLNIRGKKEAGPAFTPARKAPRLLSPAQRWDIQVMNIPTAEAREWITPSSPAPKATLPSPHTTRSEGTSRLLPAKPVNLNGHGQQAETRMLSFLEQRY